MSSIWDELQETCRRGHLIIPRPAMETCRHTTRLGPDPTIVEQSGTSHRRKNTTSQRDFPLGHLPGRYGKRYKNTPGAFVFDRDDGRPYDDRALLADEIRPAAQTLGIYRKGFGLHSLRKTSITGTRKGGLSALEAQLHAGHSTTLTPGRHEKAVRELQERLMRDPRAKRLQSGWGAELYP